MNIAHQQTIGTRVGHELLRQIGMAINLFIPRYSPVHRRRALGQEHRAKEPDFSSSNLVQNKCQILLTILGRKQPWRSRLRRYGDTGAAVFYEVVVRRQGEPFLAEPDTNDDVR